MGRYLDLLRGVKDCSDCGLNKPLAEFSFRPDRNSYRSSCKDCSASQARQWRQENPQKAKSSVRNWRINNPNKALVIERRRTFKKKGVSLDQAEAILLAQENRCANPACCVELTRGKGRTSAHLDHDHRTGKIRAFLCHKCNLIIGFADDNENLLIGMIDYLRQHASIS